LSAARAEALGSLEHVSAGGAARSLHRSSPPSRRSRVGPNRTAGFRGRGKYTPGGPPGQPAPGPSSERRGIHRRAVRAHRRTAGPARVLVASRGAMGLRPSGGTLRNRPAVSRSARSATNEGRPPASPRRFRPRREGPRRDEGPPPRRERLRFPLPRHGGWRPQASARSAGRSVDREDAPTPAIFRPKRKVGHRSGSSEGRAPPWTDGRQDPPSDDRSP
jgi:hypothetical protein